MTSALDTSFRSSIEGAVQPARRDVRPPRWVARGCGCAPSLMSAVDVRTGRAGGSGMAPAGPRDGPPTSTRRGERGSATARGRFARHHLPGRRGRGRRPSSSGRTRGMWAELLTWGATYLGPKRRRAPGAPLEPSHGSTSPLSVPRPMLLRVSQKGLRWRRPGVVAPVQVRSASPA